MESSFRPLTLGDWGMPYTANRRSRWTFKAPWSDTLNMLGRELEHLGADFFVIEADFRESDIRLDGLPKSNARAPEFPGIRVSFESVHGPLRYQTDTCEFWQHNVRSIALGLEALRAVDRYGITSRAEQYTGFKALAGPKQMNSAEAMEVLRGIITSAGKRATGHSESDFKAARRIAHPDHNGGERVLWNEVERAGMALGIL